VPTREKGGLKDIGVKGFFEEKQQHEYPLLLFAQCSFFVK
jgi:hypothetical protein